MATTPLLNNPIMDFNPTTQMQRLKDLRFWDGSSQLIFNNIQN